MAGRKGQTGEGKGKKRNIPKNYTIGPWRARDYRNKDGDIWIDCWAFDNNGKTKFVGGNKLAVALHRGVVGGTVEANAKLIAAAPVLAEALSEVFALLEEHEPEWYLRKHYKKVLKALEDAGVVEPGPETKLT